jgi:hypothetical protein
MTEQVLEGTWEEVQRKLYALRLTGRRVRVTIRDVDGSEPRNDTLPRPHKPITYGMLPGLPPVDDEDFASAEYRGDDNDL